MSEDEVVVRSVYERWNRDPAAFAAAVASGDLEREELGLDLFDYEVEMQQTSLMLDTAGTFHGHEGMRRAAQEFMDAFGTIEWVTEQWSEDRGWVIVTLRLVARGGLSGIETDTRVAHAWRVRDGRVTDFRAYPSAKQALADVAPSG
jgi:ketosteroid isomerase-like protein